MAIEQESNNPTDSHHSDFFLKRKKYLRITSISIGVLLLMYFIYWLSYGRYFIETDNAYVNGNIIQVAPQTSGTIKNIYADITDYVEAGQKLFTIEASDANIRLERARANLSETMRQVGQAIEAVEKNKAMAAIRLSELKKQTDILNRRSSLLKSKNVSQEAWEDASAAKKVAESQYKLALHELAASYALVRNTTVFDHPLVEIAKADFRNAYLNKERTIVYAPVSGYVAKRNAQVGSVVSEGMIMYAIVPLTGIWVDANFKENQLARMRIGQSVKLIADKNGAVYHGKIAGLYPGTGSVFSLLPAQNASGNWIKIVQRLPVRIELDNNEVKKQPLEIGLSMQVNVDARQMQLPILKKIRNEQQPQYSTHIYNNQLKAADIEINNIYKQQIRPDTLALRVPINVDKLINA